MNIKVIKSGNDYAQAMARFTALMVIDPKDGSKEDGELELLALVIEDYERKIVPPVVPDPVETVLFRIDQTTEKEMQLAWDNFLCLNINGEYYGS